MNNEALTAAVRAAAITLLAALLLPVTAGAGLAETADDRALRAAAGGGDLGSVERLLAGGADPNVPDHEGRTAVHYAAEWAESDVMAAVLAAGGNPDAQDSDGVAPLHLAAVFPYFEPDSQASIRILLRHRANPGLADDEGRTALHLVARQHSEAASVRDLLWAGADPDRADRRGDAPLHYAVGRNSGFSTDVVAALAEGGADGSTAGQSGETPLQLFARIGTDDGGMVDALVDAGADVDAKNPDRYGETPLHTAIRNGGSSENHRVVEALLAAGADPCIKDAFGYIPYNTAREGGYVHGILGNAGGSDIGCDGRETTVADYVVDPADWPGETTARANVRSGPGIGHHVARTLEAGAAVHVTGVVRNRDWLVVAVSGETVFIHASLVGEVEEESEVAIEPEPAQASGGAESSDPMRTETWTRPVCVLENGETGMIASTEFWQAVDRGVCVGVVEVEVTATCDTRAARCDWPCTGNLECMGEWTVSPRFPFPDHAAEARAVAAAARADPDATRAEALALVEEFFGVVRSWGSPSSDAEEETAAVAEDDAPTVVESGDAPVATGDVARAQAIATEPKCADLPRDVPWNTVCWRDLARPSDCLVLVLRNDFDINNYVNTLGLEELTWNGACEGGVATGEGALTWTLRGDNMVKRYTGQLVDGVRQGDWVEEWYSYSMVRGWVRGAYVDGQRHSRWSEQSGLLSDDPRFQCTTEWRMVHGERDGHRVRRCNDGHCSLRDYDAAEDYWFVVEYC